MSRNYSPKHLTDETHPLQRLYLAVALLLVAAAGTSMWTSAALARYVSTASGESTAQVAAFVVEASGSSSESLTLNTDSTQASYNFTVSNKNSENSAVGEVTTAYDVTVTFPSALYDVTLTLQNGTATINGTTTDQKTYVFENAGTFQPGVEETDSLTLSFALDKDADTDGNWENITITVNAAQQD